MSQNLKRTLTLPDAVSVVAGSMIGCGIFIVSADIARQVNSGLLLILTWLLAGFITLCGGLSLCELAANVTEEGGQYVYLKKIFQYLVKQNMLQIQMDMEELYHKLLNLLMKKKIKKKFLC